jgi:hypothetical protein
MFDLKIRCSSLGKIMTGTQRVGLTPKQEQTLTELLNKIKLTDKQAIERDRLIEKRDAKPSLSVGAKTYVRSLVKAKYLEYDKAQLFSSKETEKGNTVESDAIALLSDFYLTEYKKNEEYYENDFIHGNPDIVHMGTIRDTKCPWSKATFPITEEEAYNSDYEWQVRGYMWLTNSNIATIDYVLMTTPEDLRKYEAKELHEVDHLPLEKRVFTLTYYRDRELEDLIRQQVELCRREAIEYTNLLFRQTPKL